MAENTASKRGHTSNSSSSDDEGGSVRPLRKIRAKSGYNLWHAEFSKTPGVLTMHMHICDNVYLQKYSWYLCMCYLNNGDLIVNSSQLHQYLKIFASVSKLFGIMHTLYCETAETTSQGLGYQALF